MHSDAVSDIRGFVFDMKRLQWREGSSFVFDFVFGIGAKANKSTQLRVKEHSRLHKSSV